MTLVSFLKELPVGSEVGAVLRAYSEYQAGRSAVHAAIVACELARSDTPAEVPRSIVECFEFARERFDSGHLELRDIDEFDRLLMRAEAGIERSNALCNACVFCATAVKSLLFGIDVDELSARAWAEKAFHGAWRSTCAKPAFFLGRVDERLS